MVIRHGIICRQWSLSITPGLIWGCRRDVMISHTRSRAGRASARAPKGATTTVNQVRQ
jgi:hypothetical protein